MFSLQLIGALALDFLFGDPRWFPHPVRVIGKAIRMLERLTRRLFAKPLVAGAITAILVVCMTGATVWLVLSGLACLHPWLRDLGGIFFMYLAIACKDLLDHANRVQELLQREAPLEDTRKALAMIVGRDTTDLDEEAICRATVETVAENMVDGITSPLFFGVLASFLGYRLGLSPICWAAIGSFVYKSINTMDSMIGYKNEQYLLFGRIAARLDDAANFLPARLSGLCIIVAAFFLKFDYRKAATVFVLDRLHHSSPNAGHTEAAVAGALGLRLGGSSRYSGIEVDKEFIGTADNCPGHEDIGHSEKLVLLGSALFLAAILLLRQLLV
jgi:adenosylcobinamide-phosphate synthase